MKHFRTIAMLALCVIMITSSTVFAAEEATYSSYEQPRFEDYFGVEPLNAGWWNDYGTTVGVWRGPGAINVHTHILGSPPGYFPFHYWMMRGQTAWGNAIGVSINSVTTNTNAHIRAWGGTRPAINLFRGVPLHVGEYGRAVVSLGATLHGLAYLPGSGVPRVRVAEIISHARIYVVAGELSSAQTRVVTVHELGHALGYVGHSRNRGDVMFHMSENEGGVHTNFNLSSRDQNHLRQIYHNPNFRFR